MREYERFEPVVKPPRRTVRETPRKRPKVNKPAVVLGDPWVVLGGFLRVFSRRRR